MLTLSISASRPLKQMSRISISAASFPSISPEWMPAWIRNTGFDWIQLRTIPGHHCRDQFSSLRGRPEILSANQRRRLVDLLQKRDRLVIGRRGRQPGFFRRRDPLVRHRNDQLFARAAPCRRRRKEGLGIEPGLRSCGRLCACHDAGSGNEDEGGAGNGAEDLSVHDHFNRSPAHALEAGSTISLASPRNPAAWERDS